MNHPARFADVSLRLSRRQWILLFILAAVQFMNMVDFILIMPLAPHLDKDLGIGTKQFGVVVAVYGGAACVAGLLLASFLDRFDRKRSLLGLFAGFTLGTFLCAFAPSYEWLLVGRAVAGGFGGVAAATVLAIVGDAYPDQRRGLATGAVMSAFSVASIVGVPAGLMLASYPGFGWRAPFVVLAAASVLVWLVACWAVPVLRGHLIDGRHKLGLWEVGSRPAHLRAYALMLCVVFGGCLIGPYIAVHLVKNIGVADEEVPLVYFVGGLATLFTTNLVGRLADRFSRLWVFRVMALATMVVMLILAWLPHGTPLFWTIAVTTLLMIVSSGRMVPAKAMVTGASAPRYRGTFLSINSSVEQLGLFLAPLFAGLFLIDTDGRLEGYTTVALLSGVVVLVTLVLAGLVRPAEEGDVVTSVLVEPDEGERFTERRAEGVTGPMAASGADPHRHRVRGSPRRTGSYSGSPPPASGERE
jgi:predicted MFS family arabinose efflux permease